MGVLRPVIVVGAALALLAACSGADGADAPRSVPGDDAITVGSFNFPESVLLAEVYSQALEDGGFRVERAYGLGPREFVGPAIRLGLIELVPEYAGSAVGYYSAGATSPSADVAANRRTLAQVLEATGLVALEPSPAQNANTFVVTAQTARRYGLRTLSDLAAVAPDLVLGGPAECATRRLCQLGLHDVYGLTFAGFVTLDAGGPVTHQALRNGDVDVALLFGTDPGLLDFVALVDDRHLQPAENITPLIRAEVIEHFGGEVVAVLAAVSRRLHTDSLRRLNGADAATPGPDDVAAIIADWLRDEAAT